MKKICAYTCGIVLVGIIMALSIFGPVMLSEYSDAKILKNVRFEPVDIFAEGYRYRLTANERLYILSAALNNQALPQSNYAANLKEKFSGADLQNPDAPYAFIVNYRGPSDDELSLEKALVSCGEELANLYDLGVIPTCNFEADTEVYDAKLYSAVDMLESQKSVSVWQISLTLNQPPSDLENTLLDAYIDAETGKLYGFSMRISQTWDSLNPDGMVEGWCKYLGLGSPEAYDAENRLMENTPYYEKYAVEGMGNEKTMVTLGFYEGINELFLKISQ